MLKANMSSKYSNKQWLILSVYCVVNILVASNFSLQDPFYPMIAEQKGATPSQYGFVFGVFGLAAFIINPVVGVMISRFGAVVISLLGLFITGITSIAFGFVDKLNELSSFLGISFSIRILEAIGTTMVCNAGNAIVSFEFSTNVEMAFAFTKTFGSTGYFMGPVIGGALYELGGFFLPFTVFGVLLLCAAFVVMFLPKDYPKKDEKSIKGKEILKMFQTSTVIFGIISLFGCTFTASFTRTVIEPHISIFNLSPVEVGSVFLGSAIAYGISSLFWSKLCDKYDSAVLICCISAFICICGLVLLGPAPYLPLDKTIYSCLFGFMILAFGMGGEQIAGFSCLVKGTRLAGLSQSIQTYGVISVVLSSSLNLGSFIGSILGGYLYETFDFGWGSQFFITYNLFLCIGAMFYFYFKEYNPKNDENLNGLESSSEKKKILQH